MVLAASGTFEQLLTYVVFVGWIFYALGAACVFVLRRTQAGRRAAVSRARLSVDAAAVHRRGSGAGRQHHRDAAGPRRRRHRRRPARPAGVFRLEEGRDYAGVMSVCEKSSPTKSSVSFAVAAAA